MRLLTRLAILVLLASFVISAPPPLGAATTDTFRDEFNNISYSGDDGVGGLWAGAWWENEATQNPNAGTVQVVTDGVEVYAMRFVDSSPAGMYIERTADLSAYDTASLSFDYRRDLTDPSFSVKVWASSTGPTGVFTEIFAIASGNDATHIGSGILDITAHRSATTTIRFSMETPPSTGTGFYLDNVEISATSGNLAPVAADDSDSTLINSPITIDVLANDSDPDSDPLSVDSVTEGANGSVTNNGTDVTYSPDAGWTGVDTFTYTVTDGMGGFDTATVTATVKEVVYRDEFNAQAYDGSDGTVAWSGDWFESAGDGPLLGEERVDIDGAEAFVLMFADSTPGDYVERTADLSLLASPELTFDYRQQFMTPSVGFEVQVSEDGSTWTPVWSKWGSGSDPAYMSVTVDLSAFSANPTILRFTHITGTPAGFIFHLDNVQIAEATNLPPVAVDDADGTPEDTPVTVDVLANDSDPDADPLSVDSVTQGSNGSVVNNGSDVTYDPDPDWYGTDTFTYTIADGDGRFDTATVTVTVSAEPDPPVAVDDTDSTAEDTPVTVDVLANDSDVDLDSLSVSAVSQGSNGSVVNNGSDVTYSPDSEWSGVDSFTYTVTDGNGGFDTATVTVDVSPVNDDPVAIDDVDATTEDMAVTVDVLANDADPEGDGLSVSAVFQGSNGSVVNNGSDVTYDPDSDWHGTDAFTYTVADGDGGFDTATVTVTVSAEPDPPVAVDDTDSTAEDTPVTVDVLANDSDVDLDSLSVSAVSQGSNGSVVSNGSDVTYSPNLNWTGTDTFTYTVTDGNGGFDTAQVTATVAAQPDPPVAVADTDSTLEDTPVTVDVLANDSDPDSDPLSVSAITQGANGSVTNNGTDVTYDPDPDWNGIDTFTYTVTDGNGGFDSSTVTVTVDPVNDDPLAGTDTKTVGEDLSVTIPVLDNDSDVDGDPLTITGVIDGSNGVVVNNGTNVTYIPNPDWFGVDTFMYTISDGNGGSASADVTVTVDPVNDDPLGGPDSATTFEDTSVGVEVLANDSDVDSSALTVTAVADGTNGTVSTDGVTVTYTPDPDWFGTDAFTYRVSDDLGGWGEATVTVTVTPVNDNPVAVDDVATTPRDTPVYVWVLDNDTDVDPDTLAVSGFTHGANGTVVNNSIKVTYTPAPGWTGTDTFTYTVSDGNGGFDTATVTVTVTAGPNRPPVAKDDTKTINEDTPVTIAVLDNDSDPDGDVVTVSAVNQGAHGSVTKTATSVTYIPDKDWTGIDLFSYSITDGRGGTAAAAVVVTVRPINDPPVAGDDSTSTQEGTSVVIPVLANDSDVDGGPLAVATITQGSRGVTTTDGNTVTYSPSPGWSGSDSFGYTVTDGRGGFADATVTITVTATKAEIDPTTVVPVSPKNQLPVITVIGDPAAENGTRLRLEVTAEDPDGDGVSISATGLPGWLSLIDFGGGRASLTGIPWSGADRSSDITISASDGTGTATVAVTIEVVDGNRPPRVRPISFSGVNDDGSFSFTISASDPDGDPLVISAGGLPPWANLTDHGDGTATIGSNGVPDDAAGSFSVILSVTDGQATVASSLSRPIADLRLGLPPELTHQAFGTDGTDTLVATALKPRVGTPDPLGAHLTPREGLMVAFGSAVETMKNQILPALVLGLVMAWMLMIGVGRTKEEEEPEPA